MRDNTWQKAKADLFELGEKLGAEIGQANKKPTVRFPPNTARKTFDTWLEALTWLRDTARDLQPKSNPPARSALPSREPIRWNCPHCGYGLHAPHDCQGREGTCPQCHRLSTVPAIAIDPSAR